MESTPKPIVVYQTYLSESAYAQRVPIVAAEIISWSTPGIVASAEVFVKKAVTNSGALLTSKPAFTANLPTYSGSRDVNFPLKTL